MKLKKNTAMTLAIIIIVAMSFTLIEVIQATNPNALIRAVQSGTSSTSAITLGTNAINTTILIDIRIDNTNPIYGWYMPTVTWNASMLQLKKVKEGSFLSDNTGADSTTFVGSSSTLWDNSAGQINGGITGALGGNSTSIDASGVLATLTFNITNLGTSAITILGGYTLPRAWVPGDHPSDNVTCYSATIIVSNTSPTPTPNSSPTDNPAYQNSTLQLFTDKGGIGATTGGTYGPQDLLQVYALLKCQNDTIPNHDVSFSIQTSNGTFLAIGVATTNQSGIAHEQYRLPAPQQNTTIVFGTWSITASANVNQVAINKTIKFSFNFLSNIENIQMPTSVQRSQALLIELTINNGLFSTPCSQLDITIFDQANVPIGSFRYINTYQLQNFTVIDLSITIPSWAFTGQGTAYMCLSSANGTALAKETVANFEILP